MHPKLESLVVAAENNVFTEEINIRVSTKKQSVQIVLVQYTLEK